MLSYESEVAEKWSYRENFLLPTALVGEGWKTTSGKSLARLETFESSRRNSI